MIGPRVSSMFAALLLIACVSDDGDDNQAAETETGGGGPEVATLVVETDPGAVCPDEFGGSIELVTRRVDCWDPPLPCTVAQDPPWVTGTVGDCGTAQGVTRFEVAVSQTGRWETRLQAGGQLACFGLDGAARTNVAKNDLASGAEMLLAPAPTGECGEP